MNRIETQNTENQESQNLAFRFGYQSKIAKFWNSKKHRLQYFKINVNANKYKTK